VGNSDSRQVGNSQIVCCGFEKLSPAVDKPVENVMHKWITCGQIGSNTQGNRRAIFRNSGGCSIGLGQVFGRSGFVALRLIYGVKISPKIPFNLLKNPARNLSFVGVSVAQ